MENAGPGSRGVENAGSGGKRGVWWKTWGLGGKHEENVFSPKYEFCSPKMRSRNFVILKLQ